MSEQRETRAEQGSSESAEQAFGGYLRSSREELAVHLTEVARQTKIPIRSLERIEAGDFDKLPADIFVRGFLRSYADAVGLERTEVLERYVALGRAQPALSTDLVAAARAAREARGGATQFSTPTPAADKKGHDKRRRTIFPELSETERTGRRSQVTVAVIILVIVATLAMSYLLRRPSADSDGFTRNSESPSLSVPV